MQSVSCRLVSGREGVGAREVAGDDPVGEVSVVVVLVGGPDDGEDGGPGGCSVVFESVGQRFVG